MTKSITAALYFCRHSRVSVWLQSCNRVGTLRETERREEKEEKEKKDSNTRQSNTNHYCKVRHGRSTQMAQSWIPAERLGWDPRRPSAVASVSHPTGLP